MKHSDRIRRATIVVALCAMVIVGLVFPASASNCAGTSVGFTPLSDLGRGTYHGYQGGLYPGGSNSDPSAHRSIGTNYASQVTPLDTNGVGTPTGKIVFLSIGMSNASDEFAAFVDQSQNDSARNSHVLVVNGAESGASADVINNPNAKYWIHVNDALSNAGASSAQVEAVWLKEALRQPTAAFPQDALELKNDLASIAKILKQRFPNLWLVYISSRIYAGYATSLLNPEPYAYQSGFAVKWLIQDQIDGSLPVGADQYPWLAWGPYLWADGTRARSDGLTWSCSDFGNDGTHPSQQGSSKVGGMLLNFVHTDATATSWYEPPAGDCRLQVPEVLRIGPLCLFRSIATAFFRGRRWI